MTQQHPKKLFRKLRNFYAVPFGFFVSRCPEDVDPRDMVKWIPTIQELAEPVAGVPKYRRLSYQEFCEIFKLNPYRRDLQDDNL